MVGIQGLGAPMSELSPNGGAPACKHLKLARQIRIRREYIPIARTAEGWEGWCEECSHWVELAPAQRIVQKEKR